MTLDTATDFKLTVTEDGRKLAKAVLDGDSTAVGVLVDWIQESSNHGGRDLRSYVLRLEDALRECKRTTWGSRYQTPQSWGTVPAGYAVLGPGALDKIYALCFSLEREAKLLGREGCA